MKKTMLKTLSIALLAASFNAKALAGDISLGIPAYGGTGCPAGTASVALSPDQKTLSIIFDDFMVEANYRSKLARKSCNIAIPVHVPQGFSISLIKADYRGYVSLPRSAQARFSVEYFFAGMRGPQFVKTFNGPTDTDYLVSNNLGLQATIWSPCGQDVNLRVNSSMLVRTIREEALATVDSADFNAGIVYQVQWKRCSSAGSNLGGFGYSDGW